MLLKVVIDKLYILSYKSWLDVGNSLEEVLNTLTEKYGLTDYYTWKGLVEPNEKGLEGLFNDSRDGYILLHPSDDFSKPSVRIRSLHKDMNLNPAI